MTTTSDIDHSLTDKELNLQLKQLILPKMPTAGDYPTPIEGLVLHRRDQTYKIENCFNGPILAVTVQGFKRTIVGNEEYRYGAGHSLVAGVDMPTMSHITEASAENPYLVISLDLNNHLTAQLLAELPKLKQQQRLFKRLAVAKSDQGVLQALLRLIKLLDKPEQIAILAPMIIREIHFRLLLSEQGDQLIAINTQGTQSNQISTAIKWLLTHIKHPLNVDELANTVNMAPSTFRKHFKNITTMSPTQYHKHLRLYEAQRLMVAEKSDVTRAALAVGYESPIQFNREYKRLFGDTPLKNANQLR